ncbi:hypothetical protein ANN_08739 [Periplaneta americana]|uniref:Uncharacterized protein n=1 Tax=Periplaneta americana TaxID=6978 RepID=A0ABQ8T2A3_PERAM|nr:hypothetical protein ANN_08739 [Periplaneta americana]
MYPEIPLPPKPILTRWGTWLEAVEYYAEHIDSINNVLLALDSEDAVSIDTAKTVTCDISVKNDLAHIQHTFSCIIKTLKSLQNRHLSLSESFEIINSTVEQLNRGRGKVADAVRAKVDTVLSKTLDMKNYKKVVAVMSGESTVKINLDLSPADIVKLNYVPVTSCDVERSFSQYKSILRDNRRRFTFQHLKEMFVTYCYVHINPFPDYYYYYYYYYYNQENNTQANVNTITPTELLKWTAERTGDGLPNVARPSCRCHEVLQKMSAIKDPALQATNTKWSGEAMLHDLETEDGRRKSHYGIPALARDHAEDQEDGPTSSVNV